MNIRNCKTSISRNPYLRQTKLNEVSETHPEKGACRWRVWERALGRRLTRVARPSDASYVWQRGRHETSQTEYFRPIFSGHNCFILIMFLRFVKDVSFVRRYMFLVMYFIYFSNDVCGYFSLPMDCTISRIFSRHDYSMEGLDNFEVSFE